MARKFHLGTVVFADQNFPIHHLIPSACPRHLRDAAVGNCVHEAKAFSNAVTINSSISSAGPCFQQTREDLSDGAVGRCVHDAQRITDSVTTKSS